MSVDFKKLSSFVKIVDAGSMSRRRYVAHHTTGASQRRRARGTLQAKAASAQRSRGRPDGSALHTVSPRPGDVPATGTVARRDQGDRFPAGACLDRPCHLQRRRDFCGAITACACGQASGIVLDISDSFGHVLSELVISGRPMALIYSFGAIKGTRLQPLFREELFLVAPRSLKLPGQPNDPVELAALQGIKMLLPSIIFSCASSSKSFFCPRPHIAPRITTPVPDDDARRVGCRLWPDPSCQVQPRDTSGYSKTW